MSEPVEMSEKLRARMQEGAQDLLEPGETIVYGVSNLTMPVWLYAGLIGLAALPYVIQKASMAVITEHNVYVLKTGLTFKAKRVLFKGPLGSTDAEFGGSAFPGRYLRIADQKLWQPANRKAQVRARAIAEAASGSSPPVDAEA